MRKSVIAILPIVFTFMPAARADYTVSLDTSSLVGFGPFTLDFQLLDGTGLPTDLNNNAVSLTNFLFGGGSALGGGITAGGAAGSLGGGISLNDAVFFNEYLEGITPGTILSFNIATSNLLNPSGIPDLFTMAILHGGTELQTTGFANEFLSISLDGGTAPVVSTFGSAPGATFSVDAPSVQISGGSAVVPEPSTLGPLCGMVLVLMIALICRRKKIGRWLPLH